ncbi:hypothetical protein [Flammeovirga agarivorans]|uniref:Lipoprotein n=1 Tax=Flammeovirga agarivorans TaxID=2726742 RepID=A0A7X8SPM6_9BACT|nr:hypothetical protein [Flammeovirga agarivorans]NLR94071.1 hypothetical protein [Flammeovirga agarivorans]
MHKYIYLLISLLIFGCQVESFHVDPSEPQFGDTTVEITGFAKLTSSIMVENDLTYMQMDDTTENVSDLLVEDVFSNTSFGKEGHREELAVLTSDTFLGIQIDNNLPKSMEVPSHIGAFGKSVDKEWYSDSEWFLIDPIQKDYNYNSSQVIKLTGNIAENLHLTSNNQYLLVGQVFIQEGYSITIDPGTVIFGAGRTGNTEPGVLIINRGAKIFAEGTPENPIVFTSSASVGARDRGDWGGIVLLGKSPNNKGENVTIEGIDATGNNGQYGGNDPDDDSGILRFVRIEYSGIALSPGNEINTLTLGSIGSKTKIDHIITSYAGDDAYEWFGGTVNLHHLVAFNTLDDDFDTDAGFSGSVQYAYILRNELAADISGSKCFESTSSKNSSAVPETACVFSNVTAVGPLYLSEGLYDPQFQNGLKASNYSHLTVTNSIIVGAPIGAQNY